MSDADQGDRPESGASRAPREDPSPPEEIEGILAELGPTELREWKVSIYRASVGGEQYLETWTADAFSLEALRARFGGGRYVLRVLRPSGRYHVQRRVQIAGRPKDPESSEDSDSETPDRVDTLEAAVRHLTERFERFYEDMRHPDQFQAVDPLALATSMVGAVQEATRPVQELLLERARSSAEHERSMFDVFSQGIELALQLKSEHEGERNPYDKVIARAIEPLAKLVDRASAPGTGGPEQTSNLPATSDMIRYDRLPDPDDPPRWTRFVGRYLPQLVGWASRGTNPELRAALLAEELGAGHLRPVLSELTRDGFREEFFRAVPDAAEWREWFSDFFACAEAEIEYHIDPGNGSGEIGGSATESEAVRE